jgi:hypothetical protein
MALFKNQSPKDLPPFPGTDKRDFWQRAEEMNKNTAKTYNQLLLIEYEAIDVFVLLNNLKKIIQICRKKNTIQMRYLRG